MDSKERMIRALNGERPDRLPATVHQWQPYHLKHYMGDISALEAFRACGLDAALLFFPPYEEVETPSWRQVCARDYQGANGDFIQEWEIQTPEGSLPYTTARNEITSWLISHPVRRDEDIELIRKYMPIPRLRRLELQRAYDALGDDGIMRGILPAFNYQGGPWQEAVEWTGMDAMIMATYTKPDWVHAFLKILLERRLAFIEQELGGAAFDLIETGGGAASDTCVSPGLFEQFVLPYEIPLHQALREAGFKTVYHTCGGMMHILDKIRRIGCDASETLTPPGLGGNVTDPMTVKEALGRHVCLIGGLDQEAILNRQDEAGIRAEVRRLFESYGRGGGYIAAPCDHFFNVEREKLEAYGRAARDCVYD